MAAGANIEPKRIADALKLVIIFELLAQAGKVNAHVRIRLRIEIGLSFQCVNGYGVLVDRLQAMIPEVAEKRAQGRSFTERTALKHRAQSCLFFG
jgi:hypothetical protein